MSETKQKQKYCKACKRKTLHVAIIKKSDMGCGVIFANLFLCVITLGLWLPFFILGLGLGVFSDSLSGLGAKYLCQVCGRKN